MIVPPAYARRPMTGEFEFKSCSIVNYHVPIEYLFVRLPEKRCFIILFVGFDFKKKNAVLR